MKYLLYAFTLFISVLTVYANKDLDALLSQHIEGLLDIPNMKSIDFDVAQFGNSTMNHVKVLDALYNKAKNERGFSDFFDKIKNALKKAIAKRKAKKAAQHISKVTEESTLNEHIPAESLPGEEAKVFENALKVSQGPLDALPAKGLKKMEPAMLALFNKGMSNANARAQLKMIFSDTQPEDAPERTLQARRMVQSIVSKADKKQALQAIQDAEKPQNALLRRGRGNDQVAMAGISAVVIIIVACLAIIGIFWPLIIFLSIVALYWIIAIAWAFTHRHEYHYSRSLL